MQTFRENILLLNKEDHFLAHFLHLKTTTIQRDIKKKESVLVKNCSDALSTLTFTENPTSEWLLQILKQLHEKINHKIAIQGKINIVINLKCINFKSHTPSAISQNQSFPSK